MDRPMAQKPKHRPSKQPCLTWFESIATALLNKKAFLEALKPLKAPSRLFLEALLEALQLGWEAHPRILSLKLPKLCKFLTNCSGFMLR